MHTEFWLGNLKGREDLEELDIDGKIEWITGKDSGKCGLNASSSPFIFNTVNSLPQ
jgi:hypothetical protein